MSNKPSKLHTSLKGKIDNNAMDVVNEYVYLGVILDEKLNYTCHIKMLKQIIKIRMMILKKVRWALDFNDKMRLFKSSILCYFGQGSLFYNSASHSDLKQLQEFQNRFLRIIYKQDWPGTEVTHRRNNLLTCLDPEI